MIDWEEVILRLQAFTRSLTRGKPWFRGQGTGTFLMGKSVDDYVYEAIGRYLADPSRFDPSRGDLVDFLQYNIIRSLVANDLRRKENLFTESLFPLLPPPDADEGSQAYAEKLIPCTERLLEEDIDHASLRAYIWNEIREDAEASRLFRLVYHLGLKRREVIDAVGIPEKEFDNGMRRLKTAINRAASYFHLKRQAV